MFGFMSMAFDYEKRKDVSSSDVANFFSEISNDNWCEIKKK